MHLTIMLLGAMIKGSLTISAEGKTVIYINVIPLNLVYLAVFFRALYYTNNQLEDTHQIAYTRFD